MSWNPFTRPQIGLNDVLGENIYQTTIRVAWYLVVGIGSSRRSSWHLLCWVVCQFQACDGRLYSLNLGQPSKPKCATELQNENIAIIRSSFRTEMSNFSNSIKYVSNLLNFRFFPTDTKKDCVTAHLFGFSQQSGLKHRPQVKLQELTQKHMMELGKVIKSSSALNCIPSLPTEHILLRIPLEDGDNPLLGEKQYSAYCSHLKRLKKIAKSRGDWIIRYPVTE